LIAPTSVLIIGRHEALQDTRALILARAGYQVYDASNDHEAVSFLENPGSLALVIICYPLRDRAQTIWLTELGRCVQSCPF
jgi:CheY-like chemotaxis protein